MKDLHFFVFLRSFSSLSDEGEEARARYLYRQWVEFGLTNVEVSEHTVLVSKPGSTPNTITDRSSHQCFLPTGISCDQREPKDGLQQQFSYAAYSATGSVQVPRIFSFHYLLNALYVAVRQHCFLCFH